MLPQYEVTARGGSGGQYQGELAHFELNHFEFFRQEHHTGQSECDTCREGWMLET